MKTKSTLRSFLLAAGSSLLAISSASAQLYWDDNGTAAGAGGTPTGTWGTDANWNTDPTGGAGGALQSATLSTDNLFIVAAPGASSGNGNTTITVSGAQVANSLSFQHSGNFTLSGTGSITLGAGGINIGQFAYGSTAQGTVQIGANPSTAATFLTLGAAQTWTVDKPLSILANNATLGGSGNLTTAGSGRISIQGDNTGFSGNVLVTSGELEARTNVTSTAGSFGTGNIEINGGVLALYFNNTLTRALGSNAGEIRITGGVSGFSGNGATGSTYTITNGVNPLLWGSTNFNPTELILQRSTANTDGKGTLASAIDLNGDGGTPDINGVVWRTIRSDQTGGNLTSGHGTFSGNITNSGTANLAGLIKTGIGHHILSGTNTYNGGTQINQGTLTASTTGALPGWDTSGKTTVASGATLGVTPGASWTAANIDTLRGNVTWGATTSALGLNVTSNFTYASNISGAHSIVKYGTSTLTLNGDLSGLGGSLILLDGTIARSSGSLVTTTIDARNGTISAAIGGTTAVTKTTAGSLGLTGANTFNGGVTLNGGTIYTGSNASAFGTGTLTINGGRIDAAASASSSGTTVTTTNDNIWNANWTMGRGVTGGGVWNNNGDVTLGANITVSSANSFTALNLGGDISDGGNGYGVAFSLNETSLSGANTYSGETLASAGILTLSGSNSAAAGVTTVGAATLRLNSNSNGGLAGGNLNLNNNSAVLQATNADRAITNPINLNANPTISGSYGISAGNLRVNNSNRTLTNNIVDGKSLTVASIDRDGSNNRNLIVQGTGKTVVSGTIALGTGTVTLSAGTLLINGTSTTGLTTVNGGTLGGSGTITNNVTVAAAGTIAPGASVGTLTINGGLNISAQANGGAGKLKFELGSIASSDRIAIGGQLTIGTEFLDFSDFEFSDLPGLQDGTYTLISYNTLSGSLALSGLGGTIGAGPATGTLQLNPTTKTIELVVANSGGGGDPFETWAGVGVAFDGDANMDGVSNGLAWLLGADDKEVSALGLLPEPAQSSGNLVLEFDCLPGSERGGALLSVEYSDNLGSWAGTEVPATTGTFTAGVVDFTVTDPEPAGGLLNVVATIPAAEAASGKLFGRLKAVKP